MQIESGTGNGYRAKITSENMLLTRAVQTTQIGHISFNEGNAFILPFSQVSAGGALDCILYIKNLSTMPMVLSQMWLSCTAADEIIAYYGKTGTPAGGTSPVPVNMNTGSAKLAIGLFMLHTAITGLSGGVPMFRSYFTANAISQRLYFDDAFILQQNGIWTLHVKSAAANTISGQLMFFYFEAD